MEERKTEMEIILKMHLTTFKFQLDSSAIKRIAREKAKDRKVLSHALDHW